MKKVLFVNHCLSSGGSERAMTIVANYFAEHDVDVEMILLNDEPKEYTVSANVKIKECYCPVEGNKLVWQFKRIATIRKAIKEYDPDIIVTFIVETNARVLLASRGLHKYVVQSERNDPSKMKKKIDKIALKTILKCADYTVFQTSRARNYYPKKIKERSVIIPNALRPDIPMADRNNVAKKIVAVGRLATQKNFKLLIDSFYKFNESVEGYQLVIYGEGPLRGELERQISELRLEGKVILAGYVSDVNERMKDATMYVSSSDYEGISNAMLEAMAMGIPSICTDCPVGGAAQVIDDGINGVLIPVGDMQRLAEEMIKIAVDKEYACNLSQNAIDVRLRYSVDEIGKMWMEACKIV